MTAVVSGGSLVESGASIKVVLTRVKVVLRLV